MDSVNEFLFRADADLAQHGSRHFAEEVFDQIQQAGLYAHIELLSHGIWRALICAAAGIAVAIPAHAGYNYLVSRVNKIILDMERAATEIVNVVTENGTGKSQ